MEIKCSTHLLRRFAKITCRCRTWSCVSAFERKELHSEKQTHCIEIGFSLISNVILCPVLSLTTRKTSLYIFVSVWYFLLITCTTCMRSKCYFVVVASCRAPLKPIQIHLFRGFQDFFSFIWKCQTYRLVRRIQQHSVLWQLANTRQSQDNIWKILIWIINQMYKWSLCQRKEVPLLYQILPECLGTQQRQIWLYAYFLHFYGNITICNTESCPFFQSLPGEEGTRRLNLKRCNTILKSSSKYGMTE